MKENSIILLLLIALSISQVITFFRLHELTEVSQELIGATSALFETCRIQQEINILHSMRNKSPNQDETIYPLPRN